MQEKGEVVPELFQPGWTQVARLLGGEEVGLRSLERTTGGKWQEAVADHPQQTVDQMKLVIAREEAAEVRISLGID